MIKHKKSKYLLISSILGLLFLVLSLLVNKDVFRDIDYQTMVYIQSKVSRIADIPFSFLTLVGSSEVILSFISVIFIYILIKKKHFFISIFLIFLIYLIELAGKLIIFHPKPPTIFNRYALDIFLPSSFIVHTDFSYPSGHMARVTFIAVILFFFVFIIKNKYKKVGLSLVLLLYITLMFVSRIYLGEHWFSDVLGGLILGSGIALLSISLW